MAEYKSNLPYTPTPPSKRKRPKWKPVQEGLIDAWRLSYHRNGTQWTLIGCYRSEEQAYAIADDLWEAGFGGSYSRNSIRVEHKAAIGINGKLYLVNILPFVFEDTEVTTFEFYPQSKTDKKEEPSEETTEEKKAEKFLRDFVNNEVPTQKLFDDHLQGNSE